MNQISLLIPEELLEFKLCLFECWAIPFILWALLSSWIKPMSQLWVTQLVNNTADQLQISQSIPHTSRFLTYWAVPSTNEWMNEWRASHHQDLLHHGTAKRPYRGRTFTISFRVSTSSLKTRPVSNSRIMSWTLRQGLNEGSKPWETEKKDPDHPSPSSSAQTPGGYISETSVWNYLGVP